MKDLKVIFMGTPDFACPILKWLIDNTNVVLVVTKEDKEVGRNHEITFSPVKKLALENNIDVFQPVKIRNDFEIISEINPDIIITCAYGQIIPKELLDIPRLGCINVHASILPKYRGAAPIQWALLNGEEKTGVTLMYMDEHMDTGDIIDIEEYTIKEIDNVGTLHDELSKLGVKVLENNLNKIVNGTNNRTKQDDSMSCLAPMIKREDELLDFNNNGKDIINKIRAFNPWPLAYFRINNEDIKIINAHFEEKNNTKVGHIDYSKKSMGIECLDGIIYLDEIKPFGKKTMKIDSFLNGFNKDVEWIDERNIEE